MFKEIEGILTQSNKLTLTIFKGENGKMKICVVPALTDSKEAALNHPLSLAGTAEELDEGFADALLKYTTKRSSLSEQVAATTAILDTAKANQEQKAVKSLKDKPAASKSTSQDDDEEEEEGKKDGQGAVLAVAEAMPARVPVASSGTDLGSLL